MSAHPLSHCTSLITNQQKLNGIISFLTSQNEMSKIRAPGVVPLLGWFALTIIYWGLSGYIIWYAQYPEPSGDFDSYDLHMKRSRSVSIALIIYFSLCIFIMFYYFSQVLGLTKGQLTFFYPEKQVWSVMAQGVLIGFFTICGLFSSIMCLLYFYDINTNAAIYAVMSLLGISLSVIVGLAFSAYLRCQVGESYTDSEIACVKEFMNFAQKTAVEEATQTAIAAKSRAESVRKMDTNALMAEFSAIGEVSEIGKMKNQLSRSQNANSRQWSASPTIAAIPLTTRNLYSQTTQPIILSQATSPTQQILVSQATSPTQINGETIPQQPLETSSRTTHFFAPNREPTVPIATVLDASSSHLSGGGLGSF